MCADRQMTELDDAIELILNSITAIKETQEVSLENALGRVLAQDVVSNINVPAFNNSAMDGYALCTADLKETDLQTAEHKGKAFQVSQRIPAGTQGQTLQSNTIARIFTGAPIPDGVDVVIQQEHAQKQEDGTVVFTHFHKLGDNIRSAGEDIKKSAVIIPVGKCISIADIGLAASIGLAQFQVYRPLKVALFSTGDELTEPGQALKPGGIYNSNRYFLRELLKSIGCDVSDQGIIKDTFEAVEKHLQAAAQSHDLVLTTGGVSVGEEDHVKHVVDKLGELKLWKLAFKPGKPLAFGRLYHSADAANKATETNGKHAWFFGLPGNPVASYVTFLMVVQPFLQKLSGQSIEPLKRLQLKANFKGQTKDRREIWRARMNEAGEADLYPNQGSGVLTSMAWAHGFVDVPARTEIKQGDVVSYIPLSSFLS